MAKFKINYTTLPHGTMSWRHEGNDSQYCEAGKTVFIDWQPTAGWGLQEAHYVDSGGVSHDIPLAVKSFVMPSGDITISGTFKRFVLGDWTGAGTQGSVLVAGPNGQAVSSLASVDANGKLSAANIEASSSLVALNATVSRDVTVGRNVSARIVNASQKITTAELDAPKADIGKNDPTQGLKLYDLNGLAYYVYVKTTGDGLEFVAVS